jgi:hypothetical protein
VCGWSRGGGGLVIAEVVAFTASALVTYAGVPASVALYIAPAVALYSIPVSVLALWWCLCNFPPPTVL